MFTNKNLKYAAKYATFSTLDHRSDAMHTTYQRFVLTTLRTLGTY